MGKIVATLGRGLYPLQDVYNPADTVNGVHLKEYKMLTSNKVYYADCRMMDTRWLSVTNVKNGTTQVVSRFPAEHYRQSEEVELW